MNGISRTIKWFELILGTMIPHDPMMKPIVFVADVMHINEWAWLNVKN